jgi:hypothetical protein
MVVGWFLSSFVLEALRTPIEQINADQGRNASLNFPTITSAFDLRLQIALYVGLIISSPVWLYQVFAFLVPGLTKTERRYTFGFFFSAVPLFLAGCAAGWFVLPHIVGSNNSLAPWTGQTTATPEQTAEVLGRTAASVELIRDAFDDARAHRDRAVVVMTQADMFDPTVTNPSYASYYAFTPIVRALAEESASFRGEVYLFNGDSHVYNSDRPLARGSQWLAFYGVTTPVDKLQRITVDGSDNNNDYLRVSVNRGNRAVLSWTRVPYES